MSDYLLDGIDFTDITVLDAGTGAGNTTLELARKMAEVDGKGKIVSVDIDPATFQDVKEKLGELARFAEFVEADLTCMPQTESGSFDLVVCTATICALNDKPLKVLRGLKEFYRVLKKGGKLVISDEYPLIKATRPEQEVQVMRWQMYKSVSQLIGEGPWTEIYPEELELAASLVGFKDIEWKRFEGGPLRKIAVEEWREVMPPLVNRIKDEQTRKAFLNLIPRIYSKWLEEGGDYPPSYIMKMTK